MFKYIKEVCKIGIYAIPGKPYSSTIIPANKRRITEVIAEAWDIPEDQVLGNVQKRAYVDARKFYFYVMIEIRKNYTWNELYRITGRKMAAMLYDVKMAKIHLEQEKSYQIRAKKVLDLINENKVIFPEVRLGLQSDVNVSDRIGVVNDTQGI
jgi:hypothetical protein